jgi:hypothetical protein
MSLDVYLVAEDGEALYTSNITHNLGRMAEVAGIYECVWRPDESGFTKAGQLREPLRVALADMVTRPSYYEQFNAPNGWGKLEHFLLFCAKYLEACIAHPEASVDVSR